MPAGILSPYRDGERALSSPVSPTHRRRKSAGVAAGPLLPVTIRGEVPGRAMRGGANLGN
ncbi:MAG: hypothetical protein EOQ42_07095 [Mesorhizobium sp.]|nr:MAG: hypothetical protein EOQ41_20650 [Mesorhizobium sp.]TGU01394.1 hypothetical protein EN807_05960 [Mesorhizobium sp. M5C.F.Ca.ET.164.01.1.1]RWB28429.1 MAG: hypothetical protein EOQ43_23670 [Mesorhizobium sp.]RWB79462.1 MAG: hypothetical protein EOQ42_07095 [Mesorhizobium sp.]RWC34717.1 MAG: hypothetical protein EOS70_13955 [Mesorhizobium sp.]